MNPQMVAIGGGLIIGLAVFLLGILEMGRQRNSRNSYSNYDYGSYDGSNSDVCHICLDNFNSSSDTVSLPCKHKYHKICIDIILKEIHNQGKCPACRRIFPRSDFYQKK